ncbi:MAG: response regulator transcription factor [Pirellulaceae bacterium]|nr:response regulator transcription factor [Pirellulaceae bacterium]
MSDKYHILVVEDEHHLAVGIKFNLEAENYDVTVANDGRRALKIISEAPEQFDLLILDVMLPGMNGYDLCETLRKDGFTLPILILSARTLSEDKARGFDAGANQYLVKPFELDELLSRVKNLMAMVTGTNSTTANLLGDPKAAEAGDEFRFGNCSINFDTFEVQVAGQAVKMTALQMKLLKYFVEHQGRVIPRAELLENVWEMPSSVQTRAPDQFISMLRKTFEPDPASPVHFLTIRDAGYRFISEPDEV